MYLTMDDGGALPSICLVTAVLNGEQFLEQTLTSIRIQNYPRLEFRVRDGGSTDQTASILDKHRGLITSLTESEDCGMYDAVAREFEATSADVLGWLNADDILMPWCLQCVGAFFAAFPDCQWLTGIPSIVDSSGRMVWAAQVAPYYRRQWIARGWYSHLGLGTIQQESTFWRRSLYESVGGVDRSLKWGGDLDLWRRFAASGADLWQTGVLLAAFREHGRNASRVFRGEYDRESRARWLPGARIVGYSYSFCRFLWERTASSPKMREALSRVCQ
jgi:glycosyltransferase involved in cell wall biosynthesis